MRTLRRRWWVLLVVAALFLVAPLPVAAITNSEIIAILNAGLNAVQSLVRDAYCAAGVTAFCP